MPSFATLVEDTSPILIYSSGNWNAGSSSDDKLFDQYSDASFTDTQTKGATMTFGFNGTAVAIYGAKRFNHGSYSVAVDNNTPFNGNGTASPEQFQTALFSSSVSLGFHNVTISDLDGSFLDIDYVTFQTSIGGDSEDLITNTFKDTHPSFTYSPSSSWKPPSHVERFVGGSGHATTESASMTFSFHGETCTSLGCTMQCLILFWVYPGDTVALYGPVGPNSSAVYSVQVDGGNALFYSANKVNYRSQQILYFGGNFGAGQHVLKVQTGGAGSSGEFAIDFATVYTTKSLGGSVLSDAASGSPGNIVSTSNKTPTGVLAGLGAVAALAVLAIIASIFLFRRERHASKQLQKLANEGVLNPEFNAAVKPFPAPLPTFPPEEHPLVTHPVLVQPLMRAPSQGSHISTQYTAAEASTSYTSYTGYSSGSTSAARSNMAVVNVLSPEGSSAVQTSTDSKSAQRRRNSASSLAAPAPPRYSVDG